MGFARYSRDRSFAMVAHSGSFVLIMAAGSVAGTFVGGFMLSAVPSSALLPLLVALLLISAMKVWHHRPASSSVRDVAEGGPLLS